MDTSDLPKPSADFLKLRTQAQIAFKEAQNRDQYALAAKLYEDALILEPWNGGNYLGQGRKPQLRDSGLPQTGRSSSRDLSEGSAQSIKQGQTPGAVYVSAPVRPMILSLQDDNGATRRISLPPVSFGSQRLLVGSRAVPASSTNDRVW